ncbi:MAG: energy transducer TonB [Chloracidobacterium sp.]|nr:energy transducer TonB [Chloracidobacterium sp.]
MNSYTFCQTIYLALLVFSLSIVGNAQAPKSPKPIIAGVVNGKATSLPKPEYPEDARTAKISGKVGVRVLIDEKGKVISAVTESGLENVSLRVSAEAAALKATFSPTLLSGKPVKVSGVIVYNFVAEKSNEEKLAPFAVSTFLTMVRVFATDETRLKKEFPASDPLKSQLGEYPQFETEFKAIVDLESMPAGERVGAIDRTKIAIRAKLNPSDRWQFDLGVPMGEMINEFAQFSDESDDDTPDLGKLDQSKIKLALNTINDLTLSAPTEFPPDILQKLKDLASSKPKDNGITSENVLDFYTKLAALFEIISPGVTK